MKLRSLIALLLITGCSEETLITQMEKPNQVWVPQLNTHVLASLTSGGEFEWKDTSLSTLEGVPVTAILKVGTQPGDTIGFMNSIIELDTGNFNGTTNLIPSGDSFWFCNVESEICALQWSKGGGMEYWDGEGDWVAVTFTFPEAGIYEIPFHTLGPNSQQIIVLRDDGSQWGYFESLGTLSLGPPLKVKVFAHAEIEPIGGLQ